MIKKFQFLFFTSIFCISNLIFILSVEHVFSAPRDEVIRQQEQIQRADEERQSQMERTHKEMLERKPLEIEIEQPKPAVESSGDGVCMHVENILFSGTTLLSKSDKSMLVAPFIGRCLNMAQINEAVRAVTNLYIERGYVTTRATVPVQDLGSRQLEIRIIEGGVESIRLNEDSPQDRRRVAVAFPGGLRGKPLNLRDIEQGMDQLNRLPSSNAQLRIEPGEKPGSSRIVVVDQPGKTWRFRIGLDNSGQKSTGETKSTVSLDKDNLLGLNDMITLNLSTDAKSLENMSRPDSQSYSGYYTLPFGYWSMTASASVSDYYAELEGGGAEYQSSGRTAIYGLGLDRVLHRNDDSKTSAGVFFNVKDIDNYIENERLVASSYDLSVLGVSLDHNRRFLDGALGLSGEYHIGLPVLGADEDTTSDRSVPKHEFHKLSLTGSWMRPFAIGEHPFTFSTRGTAQWTPDTLYNSERLDLGSRYTVRGFQRDSLAGDSGGYVRNEISTAMLPRETMPHWLGSALGELHVYAGYDAGFIHPDADDEYERGVLQGAAMGLRTQGGYLDSDLCISKALDAPSFMNNRDWEFYWEINSKF